MKAILITGGAGFIGSHVVRMFVKKYPRTKIINYDKLTYAGNLSNLKDIESRKNYVFVKGDVCDYKKVMATLKEYGVDGIIHFAAESHVDRSIKDPFAFAKTNVIGTLTLLQAAKEFWGCTLANAAQMEKKHRFYHISTDEVYGSLKFDKRLFKESDRYEPHSPYSASKASSDHFVRAYHDTFGLPVVLTNCSNNYGPYQFPEKLIPLMINNIENNRPLPVYGKGINVRDWLYVEDHARAIDLVFHKGTVGETYNIGGLNEWRNIDIVNLLIKIVDKHLGRKAGTSKKLITYVADRAGHDLRYAIDSSKLRKELGWKPETSFPEGIEKTVTWYLENKDWVENITKGAYKRYYRDMYSNRK